MPERGKMNAIKFLTTALLVGGLFLLSLAARAAIVSGYSDTMTRMSASTAADHTILFVTPTGVQASTDTITLNFDSSASPTFVMGSVSFDDIDLAVDTTGDTTDCIGPFTDKTLAATSAAGTWGAVIAGNVLTLTPPTDAAVGEIPAGDCVQIQIGTNAGGADQITNPTSAAAYALTLGGVFGDTGVAYITIADSDQVTVTATVGTSGGGGGGPPPPVAPIISNVQSINITETTADITWLTNVGSSSDVDYGPTASYGSTTTGPGSVFFHTVNLTSLTPGTLYHYRARSTGLGTPEGVSGDFTFTTLDTTGPVISNVLAINVTGTTATITWDTDEDADSLVGYDTVPGPPYANSGSSAVLTNSHSIDLAGLTPNTLYRFRVTSKDASTNSTSSIELTFQTLDTVAPVISNIQVTSITTTSATVSWTTSELADSLVNYGLTAGYGSSEAEAPLVANHSVDLALLTPGTEYHFQVVSEDAASNSASSADQTFTTLSDTTPPANVGSLTATPGNAQINLTWTNPVDADFAGTQIQRSTTAFPTSPTVGTTVFNGVGTSHLDPGLTNGTEYFYTAFAYDSSGNFSSGAVDSAIPIDVTSPGPITGLVVVPGDQQNQLTWINPVDADFLQVQIQRSTIAFPADPSSGTTVFTGSGTNYLDGGLTNGTTYFYTVFARDTSLNYSTGVQGAGTPFGPPAICGNAICEATENNASCPADCPLVPVCGDGTCQPPETNASCPADCVTLPPACDVCARLTYDVYIINPDGSERHTGTPWVQVTDLGSGIKRYGFEDATLDSGDPGYDHDDSVVDVDFRDCESVKFTFVSAEASWKHQIRFKVSIDGIEQSDTLVAADDDLVIGTSKTVNAKQGVDTGLACPLLPPLPVCGDSLCQAPEDNVSCPADCPAPLAVCGDGICEGTENSVSCAIDCPLPPEDGLIDPAVLQLYTLQRRLQLSRDSSGTYHSLPGKTLTIFIPGDQIKKTVTSMRLNMIGSSFLMQPTEGLGKSFFQKLVELVIPAVSAQVTNPDFATDITMPANTGNYPGTILVSYADGTSAIVNFTLIIEPYGFIYETENGAQSRVAGANVTLQENVGGAWAAWDGTPYFQQNPVVTGAQGTFGFMVPSGAYRIRVTKDGYRDIETAPFIETLNVVNSQLELIRKPKTITEVIIPGAPLVENIFNITKNLSEQTIFITRIIQKEIIEDPRVESAAKNIVVPAAAVIMTAIIATSVQAVSFLSYLYFLLTQPLLLIGRRKRKEYGTVYNTLSKLPVDLAIVRLYRIDGKLVRTIVTDKQGRYAFLVEPGDYLIKASKPRFLFPSEYLKGVKDGTKYLQLYHGETIHVSEKGAVITANIPMDPIEIQESNRKIIVELFFRKAQNSMALVSVILTGVAFLLYRQAYLAVIFALQIILYLLFKRLARPKQPKNWGIVYDEETKKPIPFAVARIIETAYNKVLESRVTDSRGRYNFLVGNSKYFVSVEKPGYSTEKTPEIDLTKAETGEAVVSVDIGIKKASQAKKKPEASESKNSLDADTSTPKFSTDIQGQKPIHPTGKPGERIERGTEKSDESELKRLYREKLEKKQNNGDPDASI